MHASRRRSQLGAASHSLHRAPHSPERCGVGNAADRCGAPGVRPDCSSSGPRRASAAAAAVSRKVRRTTCPSCGASDFKLVGAGTERLVEQLSKAFPRARVRARRSGPSRRPVGAHHRRICDDLDGHQAGAPSGCRSRWGDRRGLARSAPRLPLRRERVSGDDRDVGVGRPGRRRRTPRRADDEPGHHALQAVVRGDYQFFLRKEMEHRRELGYPPVRRAREGDAGGTARRRGGRRCSKSRRWPGSRACSGLPRSIGRMDRPLFRCSSNAVMHLQSALKLRVILESAPKGARLSVDVDPR